MNIQLKDFFKSINPHRSAQLSQRYTVEHIRSKLPELKSSFLMIFQMKQLITTRLLLIKQNGFESINLANLSAFENTSLNNQSLSDAITDLKLCLENIQTHLKVIHRSGAFIDDLDAGLLQWKSMHEDMQIELFWQFGSEDLTHWRQEGGDQDRLNFSTFPERLESVN